MTRLLVALSPEQVDALDRLTAERGDSVLGVGRRRARAVGPLLLHGVELAADNERLREELDRCATASSRCTRTSCGSARLAGRPRQGAAGR